MRIGILTGGGDVPGLNPCIKAVTRRAEDLGWEVVGFRRGWAGPLNYNPDDKEGSASLLMPLTGPLVRTIDRTGGTILHTSRTKPSRVKKADIPPFVKDAVDNGDGTFDCTAHVLKVMESVGIDALIPIGGDDTLSYGARLHREGMRTMSIPKTMDNDVFGTDYCIGFSTAVTRSVDLITGLRTSAGSHERIAVIELFGRNSGETSLISGYLADVDRVLIAELPFDVNRLAAQLVEDRKANPSNYAMVCVSEGAQMQGGEIIERGEADAYGHRKLGGVGQLLGDEIKRITGVNIISQTLGYMMRAGAPDALDQMVAKSYGTMAVQLLAEGEHGRMMALQQGKYTTVPGDTCVQGEKRVDIDAFYDAQNYRPRIARVQGMPMFMY
ncbi:MAG: ATP-dependent 6-phosphofructokinase [Alphaproteobacteria bacterium]|nr:ATP-dependent 6-phosphofructokinase [Alphaproteobacteria bacterium]MBO6627857.1 ATP-dependent 6-phosphofructokinase [Alphaproteobacteria bacterium]MDF1625427.1 ATP-dependent 6-phosphofructokinase [Parvibaculaceae bacterium]